MRLTLLHAFGVILTVLLFIVKRRSVLQGVNSGKRRSIPHQNSRCDTFVKQKVPAIQCLHMCANLQEDWITVEPKCKRDPDIDVENVGIGHYPMG